MSRIRDEYMRGTASSKSVDGWQPKQSREVMEREHRISRPLPPARPSTHHYPRFKIVIGWLIFAIFVLWCLMTIYTTAQMPTSQNTNSTNPEASQ